jgi:DNA-binding CsgD family transcriptional regulator
MASARNPAWRPWRSIRALALADLGRRAEALELVEEELALARAWGAPSVVGRTLRLLGELRGGESNGVERSDGAGGSDGLAELREAEALLARPSARLEHARALRALARRLPPAEGTPMLIRAAGLSWRLGALGLHAEIVDELTAAGQPAPRPPAVGLTPLEREVTARQVAGADEREIADALFVTARTVRQLLDSARGRLEDPPAAREAVGPTLASPTPTPTLVSAPFTTRRPTSAPPAPE